MPLICDVVCRAKMMAKEFTGSVVVTMIVGVIFALVGSMFKAEMTVDFFNHLCVLMPDPLSDCEEINVAHDAVRNEVMPQTMTR